MILERVEVALAFRRDEVQERTRRRFRLARPLLRDLLRLHLHRLRRRHFARSLHQREHESELKADHRTTPVRDV